MTDSQNLLDGWAVDKLYNENGVFTGFSAPGEDVHPGMKWCYRGIKEVNGITYVLTGVGVTEEAAEIDLRRSIAIFLSDNTEEEYQNILRKEGKDGK